MQNNFSRCHVPIQHAAAVTAVRAIGERFRNDSFAVRAGLTGSAWIDSNQHRTGACSLVRQELPKLAPRGVVNGLSEHRSSQTTYAQILQSKEGVTVHQRTGKLVQKIPTLVGYAHAVPCQPPLYLKPALASPLASSKRTLQAPLLLSRVLGPLRRSNRLSVRGGNKRGQADVEANRRAVLLWNLRVRHRNLEADEPMPGRARYNGSSNLPVSRKSAMPLHFDFARKADNAEALAFADRQPVADAELRAVESKFAPKTWEASLDFGSETAKERGYRLIEPAQHLLFRAKTVAQQAFVDGADSFQFIGLIDVAQCFALTPVRLDALLKSRVVQVAKRAQHRFQSSDLRVAWVNAILITQDGHALTLPDVPFLFKSKEAVYGNPRFCCCLEVANPTRRN